MERKPKTIHDAAQLLQLSKLLVASVETIVNEWSEEAKLDKLPELPSKELYEAQRTVLAIGGSLEELVCDPSLRVMEMACQYWETRALYILAERRVPDILSEQPSGVAVEELAKRVGIQDAKLGRSCAQSTTLAPRY